jgi:tetratricopeptide (TPR) repeat protein
MEYVATDARRLNDYDRAIGLQESALEYWRSSEGPTSLRTCRSEIQLGITLQTANRSEEARPLLEHAIACLPETDVRVHGAYSRLAETLSDLEERHEAVRAAETVVRLLTSTYGSDDPRTLHERENLAVYEWNAGNLSAARQILIEVLSEDQQPRSHQRDTSRAKDLLNQLEAEIEE